MNILFKNLMEHSNSEIEIARSKLRKTSETILDQTTHPGELLDACNEMHQLFIDVSGVGSGELDQREEQEDIMLKSGKAISSWAAGRCVTEYSRTSKYLRGLHDAIADSIERKGGGPVEVLYAGCGPYATLVLPLMDRFSPEEVKFTLLEINETALESAKRLIDLFSNNNYVSDYVPSDATTYRHSEGKQFNIIVTETMLRAFEVEPQVEITLNLAGQLCHGGIFIPQRVVIDACLADNSREITLYPANSEIPEADLKEPGNNRRRIALGRLLDFTAESACELRKKVVRDGSGYSFFPAVSVQVPEDAAPAFERHWQA
ncbi:MAG: hypothetical protein ABUK01_09920 [Leptospirales bacterium]